MTKKTKDTRYPLTELYCLVCQEKFISLFDVNAHGRSKHRVPLMFDPDKITYRPRPPHKNRENAIKSMRQLQDNIQLYTRKNL